MSLFQRVSLLLKPLAERAPRLAVVYRGVRDQVSLMQPPVMSPWGFNMSGNTEMAKGRFEPSETKLVRQLLGDSDVLVNVGANIGYYCCHALSMGKSVIAFEPVYKNLQFLCRNIKSNKWTGAEIHPIALSNRVDVIEIYGADSGASLIKGWAGISKNYCSLVPTSTMDKVIGERLRGKRVLAIVDIEGAESWMLEGASLLLSNIPKPVWIVEITTKDHQPVKGQINPYFLKTFQIFFQAGYEAYCIEDTLQRLSMDDVRSVFSGELELTTHNFLFR